MDNNKINEIVETYQQNKNLFIFLGMAILIMLLVFIKISFNNRTSENLKEYKYHINKSTKKIKKCYEISEKEPTYRLCDYNICSSYNTGLIGNQQGDYISLNMIKKIILSGARYIEFQIVSNDYSDEPEPYIGIGAEPNWIYSLNVLELNDVFNLINKYAFYNRNNNPLIIYLTFNNFKPYLINKTGNIILEKLKPFLLVSNLYKKELLITREALCNLTEKIIFFSNLTETQLKDTSFESVHISHRGYLKRFYYQDVLKYLYYKKNTELSKDDILAKNYSTTFRKKEQKQFEDKFKSIKTITIDDGDEYFEKLLEEDFFNPILHFNKVGMTILLPHKSDDIFTKNIEYDLFREHGIQIISMNFQLFNPSPKAPFEDNATVLDKYLYYFREESYILKDAPKFHQKNPPDLHKYIDTQEIKKFTPEFEQNIPSEFENTPIHIELYNDNYIFLSHDNKDTIEFKDESNLFMIYPSLSNKQVHQNSFMISPLNNIIPFDYKKRMFLYYKDNSNYNYSFQPLEKDIEKQEDYYNKSSFEVLKTPVCDNSPIISNDFKIVTLSESDYKKNTEVKYIGRKDKKLSQYEMNKNKDTIDNSCFIFTKYYPFDSENEKKYKLFIYFKIQGKKYLSTKLSFTDNKPSNIFEVTNFNNIFNNNMDIMNTSNSFNLKNANKFIKYNKFPITKTETDNAVFKIITSTNRKEKMYLYNTSSKAFDYELTYKNNKLEFVKSTDTGTKPNYIECFVKYFA